MRLRLVALLAALTVTPALAQIMKVQPIQRPVVATPQIQPIDPIQQDNKSMEKIMTIEEAQAQIAKLRDEKRELDGRLTEALATIDQWTQKGGSLVHAYCDGTISRSTAGASEDCSASGYACASVEGTCRRSCSIGPDCASTHACENGTCVPKTKYAS